MSEVHYESIEEEYAKQLLKLEQEKREMRKELNEQELIVQKEEFELSQLKTSTVQKLTNILAEKDTYNNFRSSCLKLVRKFDKFQKLFEKSKDGESLQEAASALRALKKAASALKTIKHPDVPNRLEAVKNSVVEDCENLEEIIEEISADLEDVYCLDTSEEQFQDAEKMIVVLERVVQEFNIPMSNQFEVAMCDLEKPFADTIKSLETKMKKN